MFFGLFETSHLLQKQGTELGTVGIVHLDFGAPLGDVITRLGSHSAGHAGHEPRVAVFGVPFVNLLGGVEAIIPLSQGVLEIVARAERLGTQNIVQVQALVAADSGCGKI